MLPTCLCSRYRSTNNCSVAFEECKRSDWKNCSENAKCCQQYCLELGYVGQYDLYATSEPYCICAMEMGSFGYEKEQNMQPSQAEIQESTSQTSNRIASAAASPMIAVPFIFGVMLVSCF